MHFQPAFVHEHLPPQILHLHLTSSLQALAAIGNVLHTGTQTLHSLSVYPSLLGVGSVAHWCTILQFGMPLVWYAAAVHPVLAVASPSSYLCGKTNSF